MKVKKELINMEKLFTFSDVMVDFLDGKELRIDSGSLCYIQLHALPLAMLAPSIVYSPTSFNPCQEMNLILKSLYVNIALCKSRPINPALTV